nr:MaoC family dehydratase [Sphingomonas jejuensis]
MSARVGEEIGRSGWITIDQPTVDAFADATGDRQFIHIDPAAAAMTPFGGTIAHGFLLLSLMPRLSVDADLPRPAGLAMIVNYGGERTRFITPVRTGARVRARFTLQALEQKRPGQWQQTTTYTLEIEGEDKPAVVADWISLLVTI